MKEEVSKNSDNDDLMPSQIQCFAAKLGEETGNHFTCYIYRIIRDEETGRQKRPIVQKYVGVEPDPYEIAQKFRAGTYLFQFIWYVNKQQRNKSYTLDVDDEAFPPLSKQDTALIPYGTQSGLPDNMKLQLAMMHEISDVMKAAYTSNGSREVQSDPLEMFSGMMATMENSFTRAIGLQQKIMERVMERNMSTKYGLPMEGQIEQDLPDESGLVGKYAPIVKEVVDGLKMVVGMFGTAIPQTVVRQVKGSDRFRELIKDKEALLCVGKALRSQFGNERAVSLMKSFGVRMEFRPMEGDVSKTPPIAALAAPNPAPLVKDNGRKVIQSAIKSKTAPRSKEKAKERKTKTA
jgi:hypothetical protein